MFEWHPHASPHTRPVGALTKETQFACSVFFLFLCDDATPHQFWVGGDDKVIKEMIHWAGWVCIELQDGCQAS